MDVPSAEAPAFAGMTWGTVGGWWGELWFVASAGIPCVRFAPRPLTLREGDKAVPLDSALRRNDGG